MPDHTASTTTVDSFTGRPMPADVIARTQPAIKSDGCRIRATPDRVARLAARGRITATGPVGGSEVTA
jgi:hypothetical protein